MRPRTQKQPQVKKELCRALDYVNVNVNVNLPIVKMKIGGRKLRPCFSYKIDQRVSLKRVIFNKSQNILSA